MHEPAAQWQLYTYLGAFKPIVVHYVAPCDPRAVNPPRFGWKAANGSEPIPKVHEVNASQQCLLNPGGGAELISLPP